jgi:hypothetical protein
LIQAIDFSESNSAVIEDVVTVEFTPEMQQLIAMKAKIYGPTLKASTNKIDFGNALVDQERCLQLVLRNPSYSSVLWNLSIGIN